MTAGEGELELAGVSVTYGGVTAVRDVSLRVPRGQVVALLGSNGAGKSTLLRAVSGTLELRRGRITAGRVEWDGTVLSGEGSAQIVRRGVVQVPEGRRIFTRLTVADNLQAGAVAGGDKRGRAAARQRVEEMFPVLRDRRHQRAGLLSGGEQQMLAFGRALMSRPRILLLDEPSLGLAPRIIEQLAVAIRTIADSGTSVLLVEQNALVALELAGFAYVLDNGRVSLSGPSAEIAGSADVQRLYLGEAAVAGEDHEPVAAGPARRLEPWTGALT